MDWNTTVGGWDQMKELKELKSVGLAIPEAEYAPPGHSACAGCTGATLLRQLLKLLGPK